MSVRSIDLSCEGSWVKVPALQMGGRTVMVTGRHLRRAEIQAEQWLETELEDPAACMAYIKSEGLAADVFTFAQKLPNVTPKYEYHTEWDSVAAVRLTTFQQWWDGLPQEARKNTRRAAKRGVEVRVEALTDPLIAGIAAINNETPIRQGRRFTHYGETIDEVKRDYLSFIDRSDLICAYVGDELVGFVKTIYCGRVAAMAKLQVKVSHYDKRPANALITRAVELAEQRGCSFVTYGRLRYGNQQMTSLMDFKLRNGFEEILVPRYYVPLTMRGTLAMKLNLHRELVGILPPSVVQFGASLRERWNTIRTSNAGVA